MSTVPPKVFSLLMMRNISFFSCGYFNSLGWSICSRIFRAVDVFAALPAPGG